MGRRGGVCRQDDREGAALPDTAFNLDAALVRFDNALGDGQAQAGFAGLRASGLVAAIKALEDKGQFFGSNALPGVLDAEVDRIGMRGGAQGDRAGMRGEGEGVEQDFFDGAAQVLAAGGYQRRRLGGDEFDKLAVFLRQHLFIFDNAGSQRVEVAQIGVQRQTVPI